MPTVKETHICNYSHGIRILYSLDGLWFLKFGISWCSTKQKWPTLSAQHPLLGKRPEHSLFLRRNTIVLYIACIWYSFKSVFITNVKLNINLALLPSFSISSGWICSVKHWHRMFCNPSFFCREFILLSVLHGPMFIFSLVVIAALQQMIKAPLPVLQMRYNSDDTCGFFVSSRSHQGVHWCWLRLLRSRIVKKNRLWAFCFYSVLITPAASSFWKLF